MSAQPTPDERRPGPLEGIRVVELASEHAAFAGKLLAELGAEVVVVEPPEGHPSRHFEPFVDDVADIEGSLWWWHYNASKLGVTIDLDAEPGAFADLVGSADVVLEGERPGRLRDLGIDSSSLRAANERLVWLSVTPFGTDNPRATEVATDLTVVAGGGAAWSCGYDDHTLPPVRGGGNQGYQTACVWAVMGTMTALLHRTASGRGQHVDVSMHAAMNVTTEAATYEWLVAGRTVQRQTGRHAAVQPTMASIVTGADGRDVTSAFPPRSPQEFRTVLDWLDELGLRDEFDQSVLLEIGAQGSGIHLSDIGRDAEATAIYGAGRESLKLIATRLPAYQFFVAAQERGLSCGVVLAPEEVMEDPHFVERGFPVEVFHEARGRDVVYPGAPFIAHGSPWNLRGHAPRLGEHNAQVLGHAIEQDPRTD